MKRYIFPVGALALALLIGTGTFMVHAKETRGEKGDKGDTASIGSIGMVDMERVYETTGGPEAMEQQGRIRETQGIERIKKIMGARFLKQDELQEFGTLVGLAKPTPQEEAKAKTLQETSDKRAEEFKTLQTKTDPNEKEKARLQELTQDSRLVEQILPGLKADFQTQQGLWVEAYRHEQMARLRVEVGKVAKAHGISHVFDTTSLVYSTNDLTPMMLEKLKVPNNKN